MQEWNGLILGWGYISHHKTNILGPAKPTITSQPLPIGSGRGPEKGMPNSLVLAGWQNLGPSVSWSRGGVALFGTPRICLGKNLNLLFSPGSKKEGVSSSEER